MFSDRENTPLHILHLSSLILWSKERTMKCSERCDEDMCYEQKDDMKEIGKKSTRSAIVNTKRERNLEENTLKQ